MLYLIDYEQRLLVPVAGRDAQDAEPLSVAGTVAGRAFSDHLDPALLVGGGDAGSDCGCRCSTAPSGWA